MGRTLGNEGLLILDDTGFPKQGTHSVGVQRQYSGTLGKVGNCQIGVTLQFATKREVVCLDAELYLPEDPWGNNPERLEAVGVPEGVGYRPKWQFGLALLERARANGLGGVVLADSAYGDVTEFRQALDAAGRALVCRCREDLEGDRGPMPTWARCRRTRWPARPPSRPEKAESRSHVGVGPGLSPASGPGVLQGDLKREGARGNCHRGSRPGGCGMPGQAASGQRAVGPRLPLAEWPEGEAAPTRYFFSNLPVGTALRQLVRTAKGRWWVDIAHPHYTSSARWCGDPDPGYNPCIGVA